MDRPLALDGTVSGPTARAVDVGLAAQHPDVGETPRGRHREIEYDLRRLVHRVPGPPLPSAADNARSSPTAQTVSVSNTPG
ncbi:hypothetical protein ACQPZA_13950 [Pseudonocardia xinjiangensis]|uniref:hypothetical protein n=1 Tax=Pseudonocardia xinjiangensis TaxID=75289 RepID=UPI003D931EE2